MGMEVFAVGRIMLKSKRETHARHAILIYILLISTFKGAQYNIYQLLSFDAAGCFFFNLLLERQVSKL